MGTVSQKLDEVIHDLAYEPIEGEAPEFESEPFLAKLKSLGSELWIDSGDLEKARSIWRKELNALTTNNTLANQVVQSGVMDSVIHDTVEKIRKVASDQSDEELVTETGFVINCKIALRLVQAFKVKVSVELHPSMARDLDKTLLYARRYHKVCPDYFIVKIPLTPEGFLAVRKLRREGLPINFTLGFSARQNYLAARLSNPTFLNVFLGRLNQVVVDNGLGSGDMVGEKVTLATQRTIQEVRKGFPESTSRLIGASIRNGDQVGFLAGVDVLTIPPKALQGVIDSGKSPETVQNHIQEEIQPGIDNSQASRFSKLWEVPGSFKEFVEDLLRQEHLESQSGEDLAEHCRRQGVDLFYPFTGDDLKKIRNHGKIPRLADWPDAIALDDLMTHSALQSFAQDQAALDNKIREHMK
ncbi:MAG: transaldolase [Nitrospinaceae bacterium]|nr:transaldolase [Nitrospinaceae bacterium]NIR56882.1 transaldolase [Nitrospinaceae bacterium]NIS87344.1 transaldolase [Nitrospinaceae bacterium]NIT84199.1 transaldolase [Nitrospinaceae bacterium]NIU46384.1 transaldolase [Nitrospinaceae bacterium]